MVIASSMQLACLTAAPVSTQHGRLFSPHRPRMTGLCACVHHLVMMSRAAPGQLLVLLLPRMEAWACQELGSQPDGSPSEPSLGAYPGHGKGATQREASEAWGAFVHLIQEVWCPHPALGWQLQFTMLVPVKAAWYCTLDAELLRTYGITRSA